MIVRVTLGLSACGLATAALMWASAGHPGVAERHAVQPHDINLESADSRQSSPGRPVYRYSVIPGGAYNAHELSEAVERDPVVATVYRAVSASGVRPEVVSADRLVYMSYRRRDRIYWTSHRVRLRRGETILTNGSTQLRGRCGNAISLDPMLPTEPLEPPPLELDALAEGESPLLSSRPLAVDAFDLVPPTGITLDSTPLYPQLLSSGPLGPAETIMGPTGLSVPPDSTLGPTDEPPVPETFGLPPAGTSVGTPPGSGGPDDIRGQLVNVTVGPNALTSGGPLDGIDKGPSPFSVEPPTAPLPTPEPASVLLVGGGLVAAGYRKLRHRR